MDEAARYRRWTLDKDDLSDINPIKARDLIVKCFYEAQRETFRMARERITLSTSDEDIRKSVVQTIKSAFKEAGGDYDNPTQKSLTAVVQILAGKSSAWGTPDEIIEHHKGQIQMVLSLLEE